MILKTEDFYKFIEKFIYDFGVESDELAEGVFDFKFPGDGPYLCRIALDSKSIIIGFSIEVSINVALQVFQYIQKQCKNIGLAKEYYIDKNKNIFYGQDAYAAQESEMHETLLRDSEMEAHITGNVTVMISDPIYSVYDKRAWEDYKNFLENKKNKLF